MGASSTDYGNFYIYMYGKIVLNSIIDKIAVIILNFTSRSKQMERIEEVINKKNNLKSCNGNVKDVF